MVLAQPSTIVPRNTAQPAGPWTITLLEAISGDAAWNLLLETNSENPPVSELPGADTNCDYVIARISAQNTSQVARVINLADFAMSGTDGILRRPPSIQVPTPALQATVQPGETVEGYVPFMTDDPATAVVVFDSALLGGNWFQTTFAFGDSAAIPVFDLTDDDPGDAGSTPETAVDFNTPVRTGGWDVEFLEWLRESAVFEASDYRTRALGSGYAVWLRAIKVRVTNRNEYPALFPNDAFLLTDAAGEPWDNVLATTPPEPDVSREYLPGASREGFAAFDMAAYETSGVPEIVYARLQINSLVGEPRYFIVGNVPASTTTTEEDAEPEDVTPLEVGTMATTTEVVNLRSEPQLGDNVVAELAAGTEVEITGESSEADGYTWYPVHVTDSGDDGFLVHDYLQAT